MDNREVPLRQTARPDILGVQESVGHALPPDSPQTPHDFGELNAVALGYAITNHKSHYWHEKCVHRRTEFPRHLLKYVVKSGDHRAGV